MTERTPGAGGSARAEYERRLARHTQDVHRRRPRILAFGGIIGLVGLVVALLYSPLWGLAILLFAAVSVMSALFVTPNSITAWQTGSEGEERTGQLLAPLATEGFRILHDRKILNSRANIDHIVVGPPGIFVIETKSFAGSLQIRGDEIYVAGRRKTAMLDEVRREAAAVETALAPELAAHGWTVTPIICAHRADLPWLRSGVGNVRIVSGKELVKRLREANAVLQPVDIDRLTALLEARLRPAVHS